MTKNLLKTESFGLSCFKCLIIAAIMLMVTSFSAFGLEEDNSGRYQIKTADDLREFSQIVNNGNTEANAVLCNDIDLIDKDSKEYELLASIRSMEDLDEQADSFKEILRNCIWDPIGNEKNPYRGTFDGANHKIGGVCCIAADDDESVQYLGLFGVVAPGAKIMYLKVVDSYFEASNCLQVLIGSIVAISPVLKVTLSHCTAEHIIINIRNINKGDESPEASVMVGGIVGNICDQYGVFQQEPSLSYCDSICVLVKVERVCADINIGGVVGGTLGTWIDYCSSKNLRVDIKDIKCKIKRTGILVGGIIGCIIGGDSLTVYSNLNRKKAVKGVLYCKSVNMNITAERDELNLCVGGIVGFDERREVENCILYNMSIKLIEQGLTNIGGIVGFASGGTKVDTCDVNGDMNVTVLKNEGFTNIGGIVGSICQSEIEEIIVNDCICFEYMSVYAKENMKHICIGGIVGNIGDGGSITDCIAKAIIAKFEDNLNFGEALLAVGGVVGYGRGKVNGENRISRIGIVNCEQAKLDLDFTTSDKIFGSTLCKGEKIGYINYKRD